MQRDLKRALAYSTISQIGYMFLALGVSGWEAAVFHFMTHAFFKALLFLCAGVIIEALADEHDIFKMGGLRKKLPGVFWTFVVGAAALAALPFVTDGFYSKDLIIAASLGSVDGSAVVLRRRHHRRLRHRAVLVPPRVDRVLRRRSTPRSRGGRAGARWCRCTCWPRWPSSAASCGCRSG